MVVPADYIYWPRTYYYDTQPALDYRGVRDAVSDLREGWYEADMNRFARHLRDDVQIRVYFDGEYKYSVSAEDYSAMTLDTLSTTRTLKFNLDDPIWLSPYEVFLTGRHVIADPDGERSTVYVSYRLRRIAGEWYVIAVGTSLNPIEHQYTDFRGDNAYSGRVAYSRDDDY